MESKTPGYPGTNLRLVDLQPAPEPSAFEQSPGRQGVRLNGTSSRIESTGAFPRYAGQNFGVEIWYRSDPNPTYNERPVMLFQVLEPFWISEDPLTGKVTCGFPVEARVTTTLTEGDSNQAYNDTSTNQARDRLRYVSCFIYGGDAYLYTNEQVDKKLAQDVKSEFEILTDSTDKPYALGGWVAGNQAANVFQRFQGTIYMARIWNNMQYMKQAMTTELELRHIDPAVLRGIQISSP